MLDNQIKYLKNLLSMGYAVISREDGRKIVSIKDEYIDPSMDDKTPEPAAFCEDGYYYALWACSVEDWEIYKKVEPQWPED